jgi:hypothetical protein
MGYRTCVKSLLPPTAAKFYIETALGSLILLRKINEPSAVSNDYLARSAVKILDIDAKQRIFPLAVSLWQRVCSTTAYTGRLIGCVKETLNSPGAGQPIRYFDVLKRVRQKLILTLRLWLQRQKKSLLQIRSSK